MSKLSFVVLAGLTGLLFGCAHGTMRGSVAMKATDDEVHVCMGEDEVKAGDKVAFFFNRCTGAGNRETLDRSCEKVRIGEGEVVRPLNEHYSVVRPNPGVKVQEGAIVEKI